MKTATCFCCRISVPLDNWREHLVTNEHRRIAKEKRFDMVLYSGYTDDDLLLNPKRRVGDFPELDKI